MWTKANNRLFCECSLIDDETMQSNIRICSINEVLSSEKPSDLYSNCNRYSTRPQSWTTEGFMIHSNCVSIRLMSVRKMMCSKIKLLIRWWQWTYFAIHTVLILVDASCNAFVSIMCTSAPVDIRCFSEQTASIGRHSCTSFATLNSWRPQRN